MKKFCVLLAVIMTVLLAGCASEDKNESTESVSKFFSD